MRRDIREDKLPQWARDLIHDLRRLADDRGNAIKGLLPNSEGELGLRIEGLGLPEGLQLPRDTTVHFPVGPNGRTVSVKLRDLEDGKPALLRLTGDGQVVVEPNASNAIRVGLV
jgi:hypothetical protein